MPPDEELVESAVHPFLDFDLDDAALAPAARVLLASWVADAEVQNGGLFQFFWNHRPQTWPIASAAFQDIGAKRHAELLAEATQRVEAHADSMIAARKQGTVEAFSAEAQAGYLADLEDAWFECEPNEPLMQLWVNWVRTHDLEASTT